MRTNIGRSGHQVETKAISREMETWLFEEAGADGWVAFIVLQNGDLVRRLSPEAPETIRPTQDMIDLAERLVIEVNRRASNEGVWIVAICGARTFKAFWKDPAGIVRVICEEDQPWDRIKGAPIDQWVANCDVSVRKYVFQSLREMGMLRPIGQKTFLELGSIGASRS